LPKPLNIPTNWIVSIANTEAGLVFTHPKISELHVVVCKEYSWPFVKTSDLKWQKFIQKSPLWIFFKDRIDIINKEINRKDIHFHFQFEKKIKDKTL